MMSAKTNKLGNIEMIHRVKQILKQCILGGAFALSGIALGETQVTDIDFASLSGGQLEVKLQFNDTPPEPSAYEIESPAKLVLDFPDVQSALEKKKYVVASAVAKDAVIISDGSRTRVIVNLNESVPFDVQRSGNQVSVVLGQSGRSTAASSGRSSSAFGSGSSSLSAIDFRRGEDGAGLIAIQMTDASANVDINKSGGKLVLSFYETSLPEALDRRLDVVDFATPVTAIDSKQEGSAVKIAVDIQGQHDYLAYQADDTYMVSVKPLSEAEAEEQSKKFAFTGERLSLNFQDIDVRSVLQIIADFTSLNLVASDTVQGSITLRLENVPWDQALDIVLKSKGLDKRQDGNVMMVAPAAEIAEQERLMVEANKQLQELAPLETEFVRIKYADAKEVFELFNARDQRGGGGRGGAGGGANGNATASILSERGSAIVDERTNTIILTDTEEKIKEFRALIAEIDVPIKQVLIEARIVIASTDFKKELGVTWGLAGIEKVKGDRYFDFFKDRSIVVSGRRSGQQLGEGVSSTYKIEADEIEREDRDGDGFEEIVGYTQNIDYGLGDSLAVDLGIANAAGNLSLGYLTPNYLIDMELSALESDGMGEIVSQPKILTGDKQKATIKSGTEIAYQKATSSGATSVEFKEAVLQLDVTPQITPDNRVIMDLLISQDSVGAFTPSGEPSIDITQVETQALVGDGQTLVLGGIFQTEEVNSVEKVPLLGDIPYVGRLFRKDIRNLDKREVLVFITPKIVEDQLLDR